MKKSLIVLVDDEVEITEILSFQIKENILAEVKEFNDPTKALEFILGGAKVNIIVSDEKMPQMQGLDLLHKCVAGGYDGDFFIFSGHADDTMAYDLMTVELESSNEKLHSKTIQKGNFKELLNEIRLALEMQDLELPLDWDEEV